MSGDDPLPRVWLGTSRIGMIEAAHPGSGGRAVLERAWERGIRRFDTAPFYGAGLAEAMLGDVLRGIERDAVRVSTKAGRLLGGRGDMSAVTWGFGASQLRASVAGSLERLGLDRVDRLYLHDPDYFVEQAVVESIPALAALRDEGVTGEIGVGANRSDLLSRFVETGVDALMVAGRFTVLDRAASADLLAPGATPPRVVAAGLFNSGIAATTHPRDDALFDYRPASLEVVERARTVQGIAAAHGTSLPTLALHFPLRDPRVEAIAIGPATTAELDDILDRLAEEVPATTWPEVDAVVADA